MSASFQFLLLAAIEVAGLFAVWFLIRARVRRYLDLENLLGGVREEARALVMELNETADRNVSLVEDRMHALKQLLDELDRRIGVEKRVLETRDTEREVYARLNKRRPIVPAESRAGASPEHRGPDATGPDERGVEPRATEPRSPAPAELRMAGLGRSPQGDASEEPITLSLGQAGLMQEGARQGPVIEIAESSVLPPKSRREEALELHRSGFSADLIAARTGATVAEIELLVEIEERRAAGKGSSG